MRCSKLFVFLASAALGIVLSSCPIPFGYYTAGNKPVQKVTTGETAILPVATPVFSSLPLLGGEPVTVSGTRGEDRDQIVSLSCATEGAVIYYTVSSGTGEITNVAKPPDPNPSLPVTQVYKSEEPISVAGDNAVIHIKAVAFKALMLPSQTATLDMQISYSTVSSPLFQVPSTVSYDSETDTYRSTATFPLTITESTPGATVWYTLDGSDPVAGGGGTTHFGNGPIPVTVDHSIQVRALATAPSMRTSSLVTASYVVVPAAPTYPTVVAGITQVVLTWEASPIAASYIIYYRAGSDVAKSNGTPITATSTKQTITGLTGGVQYAFAVAGVTAAGEEGPVSVPVSATPLAHQCIVDIQLYDLSSAYAGPNPTAAGYYVIPQDLNAGSGGNFIYVLVKYGRDSDTSPAPITGIHVVNVNLGDVALPGDIQPTGFCDLNHTVGGDTIYLYFSRGGPNPVRSLATKDTSTSNSYYTTPTGTALNNSGGRTYTWIDTRDLNAGAGGDTIYLGSSSDFVD